ncbi:MAG: lipocalin-like domain-containing protein [Gemmatimonadaceae bacterium]
MLPPRAVPAGDTINWRYGFAPVGYLVYDATGRVFWQIFGRAAMDSLQVGRERHVSDRILLRLSEGFSAQFGTCTVDEHLRTVTHHYEGEIHALPRGHEVATRFHRKVDSLFIGGDTQTSLRFVRVR